MDDAELQPVDAGDGGGDPQYDDGGAAAADADAAAAAAAEAYDAAADAAVADDRGDGATSAVPVSDDGLPFHVHDQVVWLGKYRGAVQFIGNTDFAPDLWVGVKLDKPVGKNDGSVRGVRYFDAEPNHGIFLRPDALKPYDEQEWAATTIGAQWRGFRTHRSGASQDAAAGAAADAGNAAAAAAAAAADIDADADTAARVAAAEAAADAAVRAAAAAAAFQSSAKAGLKGSASASSMRTASSSSAHTAAGPNGSTTKTTRNTTTTTFVSSTRRNQVVNTPAPRPLGTSASAGAIPPRSPAARTPAAAATMGSPLHPYGAVPTRAERDTLGAEATYFAAAASAASSRAGSPSQLQAVGNHKIWVWGDNEKGELSIQPATKKNAVLPTEMRYPGHAPMAQVSLGLRHTVALNTNNEVFTAGEWVLGCLGHGDAVRHDLNQLKRLKRIGGNQPVPSSAAAASTDDDTAAAAAAAAAAGVIDPSVRIVQVSCGDTHCVALYATGELYTWGGTLYGKLGSTGAELKNRKVVRVDCGNWHTAVCTDKGHVYTFGGGSKNFNFGQLGHGEINDAKSARKFKECPNPTLVQYFVTQKINVKDICCGGFHTLALTDAGDVYAWGKGEYGQLGFGTDSNHSIPKLINSLHEVGKVAAISAGENHSLAATVTGDLYSWGYGLQGQLGHATGKSEKVPRLVQTLHASRVQIVQVACGWRHSMALSNDLEVYCWGYGDKGQLGLGDHSNKLVPSVVEALRGKAIRQISAGGSHSLAANFQFQTTTDIYRMLEEWRSKALEKERADAVAAEIESERLEKQRQTALPPPTLRSPPERPERAPPPKPPEPLSAPRPAKSTVQPQPQPQQQPSPLTPLTQLSPLPRNPNDGPDAFIDDLGPDLSRASGAGPGPGDVGRRVRVVWSDSLALVHKFVTFQSPLPFAQFESLIHGFVKRCYAQDSEVKFDDIVVTRPKVRSGLTRVTVMFVGPPAYRDLGPLHVYWPEWARVFWQMVMDERLCDFPVGTDTSAHVPVFRELRPMAEKARILRDRAAAGLPTHAIDDLKAEGAELNYFNAEPTVAAALAARHPQIEAAVHRAAAGDAYFVLNKPNFAAIIDGAPPQYAAPAYGATAGAGGSSAGRVYYVPPPAPAAVGAATAAPSYAPPLHTGPSSAGSGSGAGAGPAAPSRAQSTIAAARAHLSQSKAASGASPAGTPRAAAGPAVGAAGSGSGAAGASPGSGSNRKTTTTTTTTTTIRVIKTPVSGAARPTNSTARPT